MRFLAICAAFIGVFSASITNAAPIGELIVVGDIARCGDDKRQHHDEKVAEITRQAVQSAKAQGLPVRLLLLGDLAYKRGSIKQFRKCFSPKWDSFKNIMLPVPGNHEYRTQDANGYFDYFADLPKDDAGHPLTTRKGHRGSYMVRFPDPDRGPWALFGLNIEAKAQNNNATWLKHTLSASAKTTPCMIAFSHQFRFSSGQHGHNDIVWNPNAKTVFGNFPRSLYQMLDGYGTSLILSAHDHHFEQFARQNADGIADKNGIRSFIVGTGGGKPYLQNLPFTYRNQAPNQEMIIPDKFGLMRIKLFQDHYTWSFIDENGAETVPEIHSDACAK